MLGEGFGKILKFTSLAEARLVLLQLLLCCIMCLGFHPNPDRKKHKKSRISVNRVWPGSNRGRAIHEPKP